MSTIKLILLSLILVVVFTSVDNAQDKNTKSKTDTKMEGCSDTKEKMEGCSETKSSCCSSTEKMTSAVKAFNELCPVMGNKVDPEVKAVEYKGKYYGFCCSGCDDKFQKNPEKYIGNLSSDGKKFTKDKS